MLKKKNIYFISINSFSTIPVIRFIVSYLGNYNAIYLLDCIIIRKYDYNSVIKRKHILQFKSASSFYKQRIWIKYYKYLVVINYIFSICLKKQKNKKIYTPDFQVLSIALFLKKLFNQNKLIVVYHQFELTDPSEIKGLNLFMYKYCLKNSKLINLCIFPEINRAKFFSEKADKINKLIIFPNTCFYNEISDINFVPSKEFIVGHIGNFGLNHYTKELFHAIEELSDIPITFMFIGRKSEEIKEELRKIKNPNFISIDEVPHSELPKYYQKIDVGLILYKGISLNFEYCAPNKLYEYWSNGIPVIAHKLQGLIPIFTEEYLGSLIDFNNINEIKQIILYYLENQKTLKGNREKTIAFFNEKLSISTHLSHLQEQLETL